MRATLRRIAVVLVCVASAFICEIVLAEPLYRFGVPPWQRGQSVDDIRRLYEPHKEVRDEKHAGNLHFIASYGWVCVRPIGWVSGRYPVSSTRNRQPGRVSLAWSDVLSGSGQWSGQNKHQMRRV